MEHVSVGRDTSKWIPSRCADPGQYRTLPLRRLLSYGPFAPTQNGRRTAVRQLSRLTPPASAPFLILNFVDQV
jgi:hypothetical protein